MKKIIIYLLILLIIFTIILEIKIPGLINQYKYTIVSDGHSVYEYFWYNWNGFWALFGFGGCIILIFFTKVVINKIIKRDENYYA